MVTKQQVDLSEFVQLSKPRHARCGVGNVLEKVNGGERDQLAAALASESQVISHSAITLWLEARGHRIKAGTVSRHRRGQCACDG